MRLLQAMAGGRHGGAEAFFERLAMAFGRRGLAQRLLIRRDAARAERLRQAGLDAVELSFGGRLDLATRGRFAREIEAFAPDVVLTWMSRATHFCPCQRAPRPFVHAARLGGYYQLKYYRRCDHLIGNTQDIVDYLVREGWPKERAHYLPNFVSAERLPPVPRASFGTPEGAPLLLGLGRLHANKAFDRLIEALAQVPGAWLWIAGEGPERGALTRRAAAAGVAERVRFVGWREDVPALFAACDLFVSASRREPLGNVVIEAWAQGKPVVATASQGPKALIVPGQNGLLVPVDDTPALARAIARLIADRELAARLAAGGREAYEAAYTEDAVVSRYLEFFRKVAPSCAA